LQQQQMMFSFAVMPGSRMTTSRSGLAFTTRRASLV
jgi:hypothetical protein